MAKPKPKWDVIDPAMEAERLRKIRTRRARAALNALNAMADVLAMKYKHQWSSDLRRLYERGAGALRKIEEGGGA